MTTSIVSWNVAGWKTTADGIVRKHGSVDAWLTRHGVDILCLQETKVQSKWISDSSTCKGAAKGSEWDTFWCPCRLPASTKKSGFNGVATFARKGATIRADRAPLRDVRLDVEGRCVFTDHGDFVLFNCYVPNSGAGSKQLPLKLKFLRALQRAMQRQRALGRHVVLCGDLNLKAREKDCHWEWRSLDLRGMLRHLPAVAGPAAEASIDGASAKAAAQQEQRQEEEEEEEEEKKGEEEGDAEASSSSSSSSSSSASLRRMRAQLREKWPMIREALAQRRVKAITVKSASAHGGTQTKFRVVAPRAKTKPVAGTAPSACAKPKPKPKPHREITVTLGRPHETEARAEAQFNLVRRTVVDEEREVELCVAAEMRLAVSDLSECMEKLGGVRWSVAQQRALARSRWTRQTEGDAVGPSTQWLRSAMAEMDLVDVFAELWPSAEARFTCWEQRTNARYSNHGGRIDYFIVPRPFFKRYVRAGGPLAGGAPAAAGEVEGEGIEGDDRNRDESSSLTEAAALRAGTANGRWHAASYDGGGIGDGATAVYEDQFSSNASGRHGSGMVYTPPKFSDHIGVSLLLEGCAPAGLTLDASDAATRACQPQRNQRRISDLFGKARAGGASKLKLKLKPKLTSGGASSSSSRGALAALQAAVARPPPKKKVKKAPRPGSIEAMFAFASNVQKKST